MKNLNRLVVISVAMSTMIACGTSESRSAKYKKNLELSKQISALTKQNGELNKALTESKGKVNLGDLASNKNTSPELKDAILGVDGYEHMVVSVPVAEHRAEMAKDPSNTMVIMVPEGEEKDITVLTGVDAMGNEITIPADKVPSTPVVTVGRDESLPASQVDATVTVTPVVTMPTPVESVPAPAVRKGLKLDTLTFTDTHESWFKGGAEVYLIVAYMGKDGKGVTKTVEVQGADKANTVYSLDQIIHLWDDNKYQFVDIAFMEHDSNADFSQIAATALSGGTLITSGLYPAQAQPVTVVGDVLDSALKALPNSTFVDNDDYMDTIKLVEKDKNGDRVGIKGEVTVSFTTYELPLNDGQ